MVIKILECILLGAASVSCLTSSVMMIASMIEDKKRTKYQEERTKMEKEHFEKEMARLK